MERLFRSRMEYVTAPRDESCFLCEAVGAHDDAAHLILRRGEKAFVILNKYPYNTGHVVIAPNRHVGEIEELTAQEQSEAMSLVGDCVRVLRNEMHPQGFNIGANLGEVAGAGLPGHFHWHVVPRWSGDTNFMPVTAETKVLPESLEETFSRLTPAFRT